MSYGIIKKLIIQSIYGTVFSPLFIYDAYII